VVEANARLVLDVDPRNGGNESVERLQAERGTLPQTPVVSTGGGGLHYYYLRDPGVGKFRGKLEGYPGIDVKADGGYVVAPPSVHRSGGQYCWRPGPDECEVADLPAWLLDMVRKPAGRAQAVQPKATAPGATQPNPQVAPPRISAGCRNQELARLAGKLRRCGLEPREIEGALLEINALRCQPPLADDEVKRIARSVGRYQAPSPNATEHRTDQGNARCLVRDHGKDLLRCPDWGWWLVFDGKRWSRDRSGEVMRRAKDSVGRIEDEAESSSDQKAAEELMKHARRSENVHRLRAMITLAESEPGVSVLPEDFDEDAWLLNVDNGTLDLRSATLRPHDRSDRITKLAPVPYDTNASCDRWLAFLEEVLPDPEVRTFIQRAVGYSLTGRTDEQVLLLLHGFGANGKSTFLETIHALVGDYGWHSPADTFLARRDTGVPNDVAKLQGRRFVSAVECEEGRQLAESRIKGLTGGDRVPARFMRAEWFDFKPVCKIWLATNAKPTIRGNDLAIWRRIRLVPFDVTIDEARRDPHLPAKLLEELPGILRWAVEGCLDWQKAGLQPPKAVREATTDYRGEEDVFGAFVTDCFEIKSGSWIATKEIRRAYERWCEETGHRAVEARSFRTGLRERGLWPDRKGGQRGWVGIEARPPTAEKESLGGLFEPEEEVAIDLDEDGEASAGEARTSDAGGGDAAGPVPGAQA
jgi:putative DNA primase/helicase